jgi:SAM-dependent methyltransferase
VTLYGPDLTYVHHTGFGRFAEHAAPGLLRHLRDAGIHDGLVVDLACGSGIWAQILLRHGYQVLGIDASAAMVELARQTAPAGKFVIGSAHEIAIPPCAAVTAIGEGITYLAPDQKSLDILPLLENVHHALGDGGVFIFDVVERSTESPMSYQAERSGDGWHVATTVEEDPSAFLVTRVISLARVVDGVERRTKEVHRVRTFARAEIEEALRGVGFAVDVTRRYGSLDLAAQRLGLVACKCGAPPC